MIHTCIEALGVRYGRRRLTNDWYRDNHPQVLAEARERRLARAFHVRDRDASSRDFDDRMGRHVEDPFRGATVRYKLAAGETSRTLELDAARDALAAADVPPDQVDGILCASWLPEDFVAPGNAVFHARDLGIRAPAFNVESACSSGLAALELAEGLLAVGRYRRLLVVLSNTVSRQAPDPNTLGWISSDVAAAVLLRGDAERGEILGSYMENTAATCGVFVHRTGPATSGANRVSMEVGDVGSKALRASSSPELIRRLCQRALDRAGVHRDDIALFGFSTPLAWFADLCGHALGVEGDPRVHDLFPRVANAGLPFPAVHLHHAMHEGRLEPGQLALLLTMGSASSAGAMVVRAGAWSLGPHPSLEDPVTRPVPSLGTACGPRVGAEGRSSDGEEPLTDTSVAPEGW